MLPSESSLQQHRKRRSPLHESQLEALLALHRPVCPQVSGSTLSVSSTPGLVVVWQLRSDRGLHCCRVDWELWQFHNTPVLKLLSIRRGQRDDSDLKDLQEPQGIESSELHPNHQRGFLIPGESLLSGTFGALQDGH